MERAVTVACVQAEPVILDRDRTLDRLEELAAEAARNGAELVVFPETFVPVYPSSRWAKTFAGWQNDGAKATFARIAQNSIAVGSREERRLGAAAKELGIWLVTGVNEVDAERPGTIYNSLLYHSPTGELALHHRKLVPTNHERLVWGPGDGRGLEAGAPGFRPLGGPICSGKYMPLARPAPYHSGAGILCGSAARRAAALRPGRPLQPAGRPAAHSSRGRCDDEYTSFRRIRPSLSGKTSTPSHSFEPVDAVHSQTAKSSPARSERAVNRSVG